MDRGLGGREGELAAGTKSSYEECSPICYFTSKKTLYGNNQGAKTYAKILISIGLINMKKTKQPNTTQPL
jgi:hypothetical protein